MTELFAAVIGGLVAGIFSLFTLRVTLKNNTDISIKNNIAERNAILRAIYDELEVIWGMYNSESGAAALITSLKDGEALTFYYPVLANYFIIYDSNADMIGKIEDHDLRRSIIVTYSYAKGLVDSIRMNNELVRKFELAHEIYTETKNQTHLELLNQKLQVLASYAQVLKKSHFRLKESYNDLSRRLNKQGIISEPVSPK